MPLHHSKRGLRMLGVAESFVKSRPRSCLAGVVMRGDLRIDGISFSSASVGGCDATQGVLEIYRLLDRMDINAIMLSGDVISWFNIIEPQTIYNETGRPVISLSYEESGGLEAYIKKYFPTPHERLKRYMALGERSRLLLKTGYHVYVRVTGATIEEAHKAVNRFTIDGRIPEPIRVARLIARARLNEGYSSFFSAPKTT